MPNINISLFVSTITFLLFSSMLSAQVLQYDQELIADISVFGEVDEYSFWGTQGDKILIRMRDAETGIDACMDLFDPNGQLVASDCGDGGTVRIEDFELIATGNYILKVWDHNNNDTGDYGLAIQVLNNPDYTVNINCGDDLVKSLTHTVEIDAYSFSAVAGDDVAIRMRSTSNYFESKLVLYDPSGNIVAAAVGSSGGPTRITAENLPVDGVYTILAMDNNGNDTGEYGLSFQITSLSACAEAITCSTNQSGSIDKIVEMDAYLLTAYEGEDVLIQMRKLNSSIEAQIEVYQPDGSLLKMIKAPNGSLCRLKLDNLPVSGDYMILLMDGAGNDTGDYSFSVQRLAQPDCAFSLNCQTIDEAFSLEHLGEMDAYTIAVNAGEIASFEMKDLAGPIEPMLELYDPEGNLLAEIHDYTMAALENIVFPIDGIYTLLAMDKSGNDTGNYSLTVTSEQVGIGDNLPPNLSYQATTLSLDEFGIASMNASELDNGSTDACGSLSYEVNINTFTCADIGVNEVEFIVTDNNGNTASALVEVTIVDAAAPVIQSIPQDITVSCDAIPSIPELMASDNCKGEWLADFDQVINTGCPYTIVRVWSATDDYGNNTIASQTVTVEDIQAPNLIGVPANLTVASNAVPTTPTVTANDNCSSDLAIDFIEQIEEGCPYTILRTWTVIDDCGNAKTASQLITVEDNEAPVFTNTPEDITIECTECIQSFANSDFEGFNLSGGWAYVHEDNLPGWSTTAANGHVELQKSGAVDGVESYSGNYHAELNGNQTGDFFQEFCTIPTTTLSISFAHHKRMSSNNTTPDIMEVFAGPSIDDLTSLGLYSVDGLGWEVHHVNYEVPSAQTSTIFLFRAVQGAPNADTYGNLIDDVSVVTLFGPAVPTVEEEGVSIEVEEEMLTGNCVEHYQLMRTWVATDQCGNTSQISQILTVGDFTAPVFENVPEDITVTCGLVPEAQALTATDNCVSEVTINFEETASAGNCPYILTRIWTALDDCGNASEVVQTITVEGGVVEAYCVTAGENSTYEWIDKVSFSNIENESGNDNGYASYLNLIAEVNAGESYGITLTPGFQSGTYREYWSVWIDWNHDGDFEDEGELSFSGKGKKVVSGEIDIPSDAYGTTRMRISMKYGGYAEPCDMFSYGEVEDYLVNIIAGETCGALPENWENTDIGNPSTAGSACYDEETGSFTVASKAYDIYGNADEFHFVYTSFCGDGDLIARVNSLTNTSNYAIGGIMMRKDLNEGSKNAAMIVTPNSGIAYQARLSSNGYTYTNNIEGAAPVWLKLSRDGNQFAGFVSNDGENWTPTYFANVTMDECIAIGLVVTSNNNQEDNTAVFDQVEIVAASNRNSTSLNHFQTLSYDCTQEIEHRGEAAVCPEFNAEVYEMAQSRQTSSVDSPEFHVFPNPTDDYTQLYLGREWNGNLNMEIHNQLGQRLISKTLHTDRSREINLDLSDLNLVNGYYSITVRQGSKVTTKTLIIAR